MSRHLARRARAVFVLALFTGLARGALAGEPKFQAIGETSVGYLDTAQSPPDGGTGRVTNQGLTLTLAPGVVFAQVTERAQHRLGYRLQYDVLFGDPLTSSATNSLDYLGFFDLSARVGLLLDAGVVASNQNSSLTFGAPGQEFTGALPLGSGAFVLGRVGETFTFDVAPDWRAWQGGTVVAETPILGSEGQKSFSPGLRLGIERVFIADAVGVEGRSTYLVIEDGVGPGGVVLPVQRQLVNVGVATWRHDWGREFASRAEAGVLRLDRLESQTSFWAPTGLASLAYVAPFGSAELTYSHTVTTNLVLGQTLLADDVRLRAGLPLTNDGRLALAATAGYQHGLLVDETVNLAADVDTVLADAALGWQVTRPLSLGLRYQHVDQWSDVTLPGLPRRFVQNAILLGATLKLPPDAEMPRTYRAPVRVDGTDEIRDTAQTQPAEVRPPNAR